ncbi:MAG: acyl-CoA dehydrogenase family protein [Rhodobacteraceae bacterium]|nr:acyl-CoA dehydrogenase family protein [Paracoccaceae bacterium]
MELGLSERARQLHSAIQEMIADEIIPLDGEFLAEVDVGDRWTLTRRQQEILTDLKHKARSRELWNLWHTSGDVGLTTVEYAYFAEEMGHSYLAPEVFNCNAPDTGNMEVLLRFGTSSMRRKWLQPLLEGEIRSAFLMTEPGVASSDATNISMNCEKDADGYILNGEKWWATGAGDPRCRVYIIMVRTADDAPRHRNHSMLVIPADTAGISIVRPMEIYGNDDAPHGHMHICFENVRVSRDCMLLGEGRGFEIAQGRLGPGRIHHCMRAIGQAERALASLCRRSHERIAFGKPLARLGGNADIIAQSRIEIEAARLLCLKAAWMMDQGDEKAAAPWISMAKTQVPAVALRVTDEAIQMHGAAGISQDTPLARQWLHLRTLRLADGPDAVHRRQIARAEAKRFA